MRELHSATMLSLRSFHASSPILRVGRYRFLDSSFSYDLTIYCRDYDPTHVLPRFGVLLGAYTGSST